MCSHFRCKSDRRSPKSCFPEILAAMKSFRWTVSVKVPATAKWLDPLEDSITQGTRKASKLPTLWRVRSRPGFPGYEGFQVMREREFFIDNLLVRNHFIIEMIRWTGLAPWEFEFPFPGSLTSTILMTRMSSSGRRPGSNPGKCMYSSFIICQRKSLQKRFSMTSKIEV